MLNFIGMNRGESPTIMIQQRLYGGFLKIGVPPSHPTLTTEIIVQPFWGFPLRNSHMSDPGGLLAAQLTSRRWGKKEYTSVSQLVGWWVRWLLQLHNSSCLWCNPDLHWFVRTATQTKVEQSGQSNWWGQFVWLKMFNLKKGWSPSILGMLFDESLQDANESFTFITSYLWKILKVHEASWSYFRFWEVVC